MTNLNWEAFKVAAVKGLISLAWRAGMMVIAGVLAIISNSIGLLDLSPALLGVIGLILGELTKQFNIWEKTKIGVARVLGG